MVAYLFRIWLAGWLCFVFSAVRAHGNGVPDIQVPLTVLDLGDVLEGAPATGSFTVSNCGDGPLILKKVGRSACGHVKAFTRTIDPGTSGKIDVRLTTLNKQGKIEGGFFVYSNDSDQPRLFLRATARVRPLVAVMPDRVYFSGFADQAHRTVITLQSNLARPMRIESLACSIEDRLDYRLKTVVPGRTWRLEVAARQPSPGTFFRGRFIFETDCADKPAIIVPVLTRIVDDVEVMPPVVDFGLRLKKDYAKSPCENIVKSRDWKQNWHKLPRPIILRVNRGKDVKIKEVGIDDPLFQVEHKALTDGRLYRLTVTPQIDQMSAGRHETLLRVHTDSPDHETFEVPIQVSVK